MRDVQRVRSTKDRSRILKNHYIDFHNLCSWWLGWKYITLLSVCISMLTVSHEEGFVFLEKLFCSYLNEDQFSIPYWKVISMKIQKLQSKIVPLLSLSFIFLRTRSWMRRNYFVNHQYSIEAYGDATSFDARKWSQFTIWTEGTIEIWNLLPTKNKLLFILS